jgi:hypothetical protein
MASSKKSTKKTSEPVEEKNTVTKQEKKPKKTENKIDKSLQDTQLVNPKEYEKTRVMFAETQETPVQGGVMRRVKIYYKYKDGKVGPLILPFGKKYCYGVQPNNINHKGEVWTDKETGKPKDLTGYKVPLVMQSKEPTNEEKEEIEFLDNFQEFVKEWCLENKDKIGKGSKKREHITGMIGDLLYRKDDKAPIYYTTLIYYSKKRSVDTKFYGPGDEEMDPLAVTGHCYIQPSVWLNEITIVGKGINIGSKIYDAAVEPIARQPKKRLAITNKITKELDQDFTNKASDSDTEGKKTKTKTKVKPQPESESE